MQSLHLRSSADATCPACFRLAAAAAATASVVVMLSLLLSYHDIPTRSAFGNRERRAIIEVEPAEKSKY